MEFPFFTRGWLITQGKTTDATQLAAVQQLCAFHDTSDIYSCDETSLNWSPGNRLTIHLCCNTDGSDRLPLWIIGRRASLDHTVGAVWKNNGTAWMTGEIMLQWLLALSEHVKQRRILLLMDDFSAHKQAIDKAASQAQLRHIAIAYLPNVHPLYQIIQCFKAHYRRRWLDHMMEHNPTIDILKAVRWSVQAWRAVSQGTIRRAWNESTLVAQTAEHNQQTSALPDPVTTAANALRLLPHLHQGSIDDFIDPIEERVDDSQDLLQLAIALHSRVEGEPVIPVPPVSRTEALAALETLRRYEMQQPDGQHQLLDVLDDHEAVLQDRAAQETTHSSVARRKRQATA